jgi:hypothetical protein
MPQLSRRAFCGSAALAAAPLPAGPYLGQQPPGRTPQLFAPGVVNVGLHTRDVAISPQGDEFYFRVSLPQHSRSVIVGTRIENGRWTAPEIPSFAADPRWRTLEPSISPDGRQFFFVSDEAAAKPGPMGVWVMDRAGNGWGEPRRLPEPINTKEDAFFPSMTSSGALYFARDGSDGAGVVLRSRWKNGAWSDPEKLPPQVNCGRARYNPFVAPDESYIILAAAGLKDSLGGLDYYVIFRRSDDAWTEPVNLGAEINTSGSWEHSPFVTRDGRYFFFMSSRVRPDPYAHGKTMTFAEFQAIAREPGANGDAAIYWMDAGFLAGLRKKAR